MKNKNSYVCVGLNAVVLLKCLFLLSTDYNAAPDEINQVTN